MKIGAQSLNAAQLIRANRARVLLLFAPQLRFRVSHIAQTAFPFGLQTARNQTVLGFDGPVTALRLFCLIAQTFHFEPPLRQRSIVIISGLLHRQQHRFYRGRSYYVEKGCGN
jgi:hypothetical protein